MALIINKTIYSELLTAFQPKVIKTQAEYDEAHRILVELIMLPSLSPEQIELRELIIVLLKEFDHKQNT